MGLTSNDLPEDLLLIIFLLQPMKTLVLLRTVCKLWHRIISSKYFLQLFLSHQRTSTNTYKYFLLQDSCQSKSLVDSETLIYSNIYGKNYECHGICDGLFCLSSTKDPSNIHSKILLWNPIFMRKLPPLKKIRYSQAQYTHLLFGYHDDDYKVLKFVFFPRRYYICIYSLRTDDWKVLEYVDFVSSTFTITRRYLKGRLVNGCAYIVEDSRESDRGIISFDLSCQKFRKTKKLPVDFWSDDNFIMEEYRESLALIGRVRRENEYVVVMWVLRLSDDNSYSWDEMSVLKLERNQTTFDPMGFMNKDELVMWSRDYNAYGFLYNVKNKCRREFQTRKTSATTVVRTSSNVKYSSSVGAVARVLCDFNKLRTDMIEPIYTFQQPRQPKMTASICTSNRYDLLADSSSNRYDVFA